MKRLQFLMGFLCGALLIGGFTSVASAASGIMATLSSHTVYVDGQQVSMTAYAIGGHNYVMLRDVGEAVNFNVYWDGKAVQIESDKPYTGEAPASQPTQPAQDSYGVGDGYLANGKPVTEGNVLELLRQIEQKWPSGTVWGTHNTPGTYKNEVDDAQTGLGKVGKHQRTGRNRVTELIQLQPDLLDLIRGGVVGGRDYLSHGVLSGLDVPAHALSGIPPLKGLQLAVFIGVELIVPVDHRAEFEGGGTDACIGVGVPLIQDCPCGRGRRSIHIGKCDLCVTASSGEPIARSISGAACAGDAGEQRRIVLTHLAAEGIIGLKDDANRLAALQTESEAAAGFSQFIGAVHAIFSGCEVGGSARRIGHGEAKGLIRRNGAAGLLGRCAGNPKAHHGKQTVKQLVRQGQGVQNIEITDKNIKSFERVARKYGVDFALKKDPSEGKYLVFFKSRDADALNAAFAEYTAKTMHRNGTKRPSVRERLSHFKEVVKNAVRDTVKNRDKGGIEL